MTTWPKLPTLTQFSYLLISLLICGASRSCAQTAGSQGGLLKKIASEWGVQFPDWELTADPCVGNWTGITCDNLTNTRITHLNFTARGLKGPIPRAIGELLYLEGLELKNNSITDPVPVEIGNLVGLKSLDLSFNNFVLPPSEALLKCTALEILVMKKNNITGQLPAWMGKLVTLKTLDLSQNKLWGALPMEFANMRSLAKLYLWSNELSGFLPSEWSKLVNLEIFQMGHNYFTGNIPDWLQELPKARDVVFSRNQFVGPAPNLTRFLLTRNVTSPNKNSTIPIHRWLWECNYLDGEWPTYNLQPSVQIKYHSNCWNNETDGCPTIGCTNVNPTQETTSNCSRTYNCPSFFELRRASPYLCGPCPSSQFIVDGSRCICGRNLPANKSETSVGAVVGGVVGGVVVALLAAGLLYFIYGRKPARKYEQFGRKYEGINDPWTVPTELYRFTLQELELATSYFSEECCIGEGGFGKVYRGELSDGRVVAIKCASNESAQGQSEFRNELSLLSRLHHRHLCALEGFCDEDGLQVLVYEFMAHGDLHRNLLGKPSLNGTQRFEVAIGIARGLDYLHSFANPPVIHRDIKPSNVLLDEFNVAKLADFGISKATQELQTHVSTRPVGTVGYLDPDYFRTNQLTVASDVFAFGVVMLELVTGQRVFDATRMDGINLADWVVPKFRQSGITAVIDPRLEGNYDHDMFTTLTQVGIMCSKADRNDRPTMKVVLTMLEPYASKVLKDTSSATSPKWSTDHFKNKSLFEDSKELTYTNSSGVSSQNHTIPSFDYEEAMAGR